MADVDIDPFGENDRTESTTDETGENIPLTPVGGSTWEPEHEQETSFRGTSQRTRLVKDYVKIYIKSYPKTLVKPQKQFTTIISILEVGNCTTGVRINP